MSLLETSALNLSIGDTQICEDLNIDCEAGDVWGVLGRNGKGKTTLLHTLAGLRPANSGEILLNQKNIKDLTRKQIAQQLGVLLQHHEDSFPSTVLETVITGRHPHIQQWQWESKTDWDIARKALETVQLTHLAERQINQLSGGERQRVSIATLITQNPDVLLLDEPNSHLDLKYQIQLLTHLCEQAKSKQQCILMTLHDLNLAVRYCNKVILLMGEGKTITGDTTQLLTEENLSQLYEYPITRLNSNGLSAFLIK